MRSILHKISFCLSLLLLYGCVGNNMLEVKVKCRGNDQCVYKNGDIPIDIIITNKYKKPIGFPLDFCESKGPIIKLVDTRTKKETDVPNSPGVSKLIDKFTMIPPGKSLNMEDYIPSYYLKQISETDVDAKAEIALKAKILVDGKPIDFITRDTIHIVSK